MRALLLIAAATLALSGCGKNSQKDNSQNVEEGLTAENIVSNDVTAIDAVTGDAANMAADVDMNFGNLNETGNEGAGGAPRPTRPAPKKSVPAASATAGSGTANSTANAATNAQ